jgi:endonuclease/exonuclease/phosphatase family metal-dependent hydrolase
VPGSRAAILTGDFNMKPDDPLKSRISDPFDGGTPALLDVWSAKRPGEPHPPSFCLFDQTYGPIHCCDYVFATEIWCPASSGSITTPPPGCRTTSRC